MLSSLFGSKNAERILLFLLVNDSCYASEIQRAFDIPLSPVQSILRKLEAAGILQFESGQKTKFFRFHPDYPLLGELKALLKAAFVQLPSEEKRKLFARQDGSKDQIKLQKRNALCLDAFWRRLEKVSHVSIQTQGSGQAFGTVVVVKENNRSLLFMEKGQWAHQTPQEIDFSKTLRWSMDSSSGMIGLEHLHYGRDRPVFLFHLAPIGSHCLQSVDSHLCVNDCYFGRIEFNDNHIRFLWRILGPKKNDILYHIYG